MCSNYSGSALDAIHDYKHKYCAIVRLGYFKLVFCFKDTM